MIKKHKAWKVTYKVGHYHLFFFEHSVERDMLIYAPTEESAREQAEGRVVLVRIMNGIPSSFFTEVVSVEPEQA